MLPVRWIEDALLEAEEAARHYAEIDIALGEDWWDRLRAQLALADAFCGAGKRVARIEDTAARVQNPHPEWRCTADVQRMPCGVSSPNTALR